MGELTPLSVEEFGEAKRLHHLSTHPDEGKQCSWCGDTWPCDTSRLIATVEALIARLLRKSEPMVDDKRRPGERSSDGNG